MAANRVQNREIEDGGYDVFSDDEKPLITKGVRDRINLILQNIRGLITKWNGINLSYLWKVRLNI